MLILVFFIVLSLSFYLYYKTKYFRTHLPMQKQYLSGKTRMTLGLFVLLFGVNQLFLFKTTTTYVVATIFILVGGLSAYGGYRIYKQYAPLAVEEAQMNNVG